MLEPVDLEQVLLAHPLEHVAERHDHGLVREQPQPLVRADLAGVVQQGADAEDDVGPALAAGRLVVELAELLAAVGLLGEPSPDAGAREPVEHTEVALAEPLVGVRAETQSLEREVGGLGRALDGESQAQQGHDLDR